MLAMQWQLERSEWWTPEALLKHQFEQLRSLADHAVANVPFYSRALRKAGVASAGALDPETFHRWPILKKSEVRANQTALRARRYPPEHGGTGETWTTGSTGVPLHVLYSEAAQFFSQSLFLRDHLLHRRDFSRKLAVINYAAQAATQEGWGTAEIVYPTGPLVSLNSRIGVEVQLDWLIAEQPAYLLTQASNARALLLHSRETGKRPSGLLEVITLSDMPAADLAELAREVWGASLASTYICEECGPIASQCSDHQHYLVNAENIYLEVLREDGSACAAGETGRVVLTTLHNFAMPLIRYEIGDYAELGEGCSSGRGLPVLNRIVGRVRNMARDPTGRQFWPSFSGNQLLSVAPFHQIQLVQRSLESIEFRFVMERDLTSEERLRLRESLRGRFGYPFEIIPLRVDAIERAPGGKFEEFISAIEP